MTHHAYYIEGSMSEFERLKKSLRPYVAQKHDRFSIDDARALTALAALRPAGEALYLVAASSITTEAQQALLKLLEEPQAGVSFVFLVPHGSLLPTVRSRMEKYLEKSKLARQNSLVDVPERGTTRGLFDREVLTFLASTQKSRSDFIAKLLKDDEGVRERVLDFVNALETELYKKKGAEARAGLGDIAKVRDYLGDRSPSVKMLLEHLALSLPVI